ncbi:restriction endonuclease subunit S [Peijinzhouia sedimentorum]
MKQRTGTPDYWKVKKLGKVANLTAGGTPKTRIPEYWGGDVKWMSSGELNLKKIHDVEGRITELGLKNSSAKLLPTKSVLVGLAGQGKTRGTVAMNLVELATNQSVAAIIPKNEVDPLYLYYNLDGRYQELRKLSTGDGGRGGLNLQILKSLILPVPPLSEQKKIAEILSTWDQAISTTQNLINELKLRNKGLAQQLLTGKKRLKGFGGDWEEVTLKEIAERITRKNDELDDTVVTISAQRGLVLQEDFFTKRVASETLTNYYLIHRGEFAYNKSYSNGYPMGAFKRLEYFEKAVVTTLYICFALKKAVNSDFMNHFFEAGLMIRPLMKIAQEGGRAHGLLNIGIHDFFSLKLTIPSLEEQKAITAVLSEADKELKLHQKQLTTLKEQKKGLMQKLLTGEVRVKTKEK